MRHQTLYRPEFEHDACGIGALAAIDGTRSHQILDDALSLLVNLEHRGGTGLERNTGDGAGILFQIPHRFFRKEAQRCGQLLPAEGDYGVAMLFLPQDERGVQAAVRLFEEGCAQEGIPVLFWRDVPVDAHDLGETARACMPTIRQVFLGRPDDVDPGDAFERRLYLCRRAIEKRGDAEHALAGKIFYICSMSSRTIVYKGMLVATQMRRFFTDLNDAAVKTAVALVHSRYSTNTTPSWERAHPNRFIIHNGEINTLKGNVNWIRAREPNLYSPIFQGDLERALPIINREGSDSAILDNVLEFLVMNGRPLTRAVSLLMPEPWDHNSELSPARRAYDAYQSMLMEPWDGPAAIAFTDGRTLGAALDRNGLRPARYVVTRDDRFLLCSEVGALEIDPANVLTSGCLGPGEMLEVDMASARVRYNDEIRNGFAKLKPFADWIADETLSLADLDDAAQDEADEMPTHPADDLKYGYHWDDIQEVLRPMAATGATPLASMGIDAPLACLSRKARSFYDYFYQLFAQVTNPPIDALREHMVTSTVLYLGNHGNLLEDCRATCRLIKLDTPLLTRDEFNRICAVDRAGFEARRFRAAYRRDDAAGALERALEDLSAQVIEAVRSGVNIVVLSDRTGDDEVPVPALLAVGAVHNALMRAGLRTFADLVVECGDAISAHDFSALVAYSASGIYPYRAHALVARMAEEGDLTAKDGRAIGAEEAIANYNRAAVAGIVSIMSKMGISTVQSYHSAQIFEAVGLASKLVDRYFTGTVSRVEGLDVDGVERELNERFDAACAMGVSPAPNALPSLGLTKWRPQGGEDHLIDPDTVYLLQQAVRTDSYDTFLAYSEHLHRPGRAVRLRDLLDFDDRGRTPVPLDEVEDAHSIVRRFNTGAMSYGSISQEAHECMAIAMNRLHGRSNSGEGGEDPRRETPLENGDSANSAIKQVASGRFGVTSRYLSSAIELQIKMAQGAKPGEGGHLPGKKVYPWIARVRQSTPGIGLISPPPHHDIYSIEDLAELIFDLKCANPDARVSVKLVSEAGVGTIATGVAKGAADKILISGHNGGSGAAPRDSIWHAGLPLELGLAEAQQTLVRNGLRSRVVLEADGKLMDGTDVAVACLLGAEEFGFATMPLIAMGCLMQRDCQQDTCPAGIATQNCRLRRRFAGKPEHVEHFMLFVAEQLRGVMARLGFRTIDEMVGHPECLRQVGVADNWKTDCIDLSCVLAPAVCEFGAKVPGADCPHFLPSMAADVLLDRTLDATLFIPYTASARRHLVPVRFHADIANVNRCVGTMLGHAVTAAHPDGLPEGLITIDCTGSAGQSFAAFLPRGVELNVEGDANDYFGKGLSGGTVSVRPSEAASYKFDENIIVGNVAFMGATGGRGFVNGRAGQRFCVRNSGATVVVEGVGAHGCEYMTGGCALILGEVGPNFAAGMTGGVAFVYDEYRTLAGRCNLDTVALREPSPAELAQIRELIVAHVRATQSPLGIKMLYRFDAIAAHFVKVVPVEYERVMAIVEDAEREGATREEALETAFEVVTGAKEVKRHG
ncbi:glutamate synthase large subunit [Collinsella tanakaei]|uniref:glutamate synthase large subunit n=1 Tax=Collinsella tanakaei TaxID=626935 RepID=UPI001957ED56|nr:glutamate synthase large subunit [Collinsella tanakaei]MBM6779186.1 glutamate synthase large subunit [Collinsella tanakaei]